MDNNNYGNNGSSDYGTGSTEYGTGSTEYGTGSYGNNSYGSSGTGNTDYGTGSYGNNSYGSSGTGNTDYGTGSYGDSSYGNSGTGSTDYGTGSYGDSSYGSSGTGNTEYGTNSTGNYGSQPRESYYQDDITYTGGQNRNSQNTYGSQGQYGGQSQYNSQGQYGGQYNSQNQYGSGQSPQYYNQQSYYEEPLTVTQWLLTLFIMCIPCVSMVMVLIWAFGNGENTTRKNFARAILIFKVIQIVLVFLFAILVVAAGRPTYGGI